MAKGRIVQMTMGFQDGHNVSVTDIKYMYDFSHMVIKFMNPIEGNKNSVQGLGSVIFQIYSVSWP